MVSLLSLRSFNFQLPIKKRLIIIIKFIQNVKLILNVQGGEFSKVVCLRLGKDCRVRAEKNHTTHPPG